VNIVTQSQLVLTLPVKCLIESPLMFGAGHTCHLFTVGSSVLINLFFKLGTRNRKRRWGLGGVLTQEAEIRKITV
jgi:hypothetical protein